MTELRTLTLRGTFLTHIARGEAQVPLATAVETARTYLRKGYIPTSALRAILDEVQAVGVDGFRDWATYDERQRRFEALTKALSVVPARAPA